MINKQYIRMYQGQNYKEAISMRLSEVLSDIAVNERMVLKRRRATLFRESINTMFKRSLSKWRLDTVYIMGSQSEGTTTLGLDSDTDMISCYLNVNVIQDWSDWQPSVLNLLMIQDESISPGYCQLQILRDDAPLPSPFYYEFQCSCINRTGRVLFKNDQLYDLEDPKMNGVLNGPALTIQKGNLEDDIVRAFPCATWPLQARKWLDQQGVGQWPSVELKRYCCRTGCMVVGVGRKGSENVELEWRVSTSLAERGLMFSLNITQIRCYVLMKMIKKDFIDPLFRDVISSYMCKTVLFHCIENTQTNIWREYNLLVCLSVCVSALYNSVRDEYCPHFIISGNNLMRGKIPPETKSRILDILQHIIDSDGSDLLGIKCDNLGKRLQLKFSNICPIRICDVVSGNLLLQTSVQLQSSIHEYVIKFCKTQESIQQLKQCISKILGFECHNKLEKTVQNMLAKQLCAFMGSVLASISIQQYNNVSAEALSWINLCLDDVSCKLKLASMLYCTRQFRRTESVLINSEENYDENIIMPLCSCHAFEFQVLRPGFRSVCDQHDEEAILSVTANCIRFLPSEFHCVPKELKQEMFRTTNEDKIFREETDFWMDWAVMDSLTFLYFLQYKMYHNLGRQEQKHKALANLARTIEQEPDLGHRETAWNILGQCMEQERRPRHALHCYSLSLNVRRRNNAAKIHICRLLNNMLNNPQ